ncbi:MAG: DUF305 domain-containing protein [Actinobacteria bacterium]|jgi:uncharacterized protein (DUF305 family)|nr:DUF305 domain-containing protein [Actinomycetota bacterium]
MQINVDRKTAIFVAIITGLIIVIGFQFVNKNEDEMPMSHMGHGMSQTKEFSGADIMFAQMMIPHHEQALLMSGFAETRSSNEEVKKLARQIYAEQEPEIAQMKLWLEKTNSSMDMGHDMGMNGMLTDSEIEAMKSATGKAFDRLFLEGMIAHHEGAIHMAEMIVDSDNAEARKLGQSIQVTQQREIDLMKEMLKTIN